MMDPCGADSARHLAALADASVPFAVYLAAETATRSGGRFDWAPIVDAYGVEVHVTVNTTAPDGPLALARAGFVLVRRRGTSDRMLTRWHWSDAPSLFSECEGCAVTPEWARMVRGHTEVLCGACVLRRGIVPSSDGDRPDVVRPPDGHP